MDSKIEKVQLAIKAFLNNSDVDTVKNVITLFVANSSAQKHFLKKLAKEVKEAQDPIFRFFLLLPTVYLTQFLEVRVDSLEECTFDVDGFCEELDVVKIGEWSSLGDYIRNYKQ